MDASVLSSKLRPVFAQYNIKKAVLFGSAAKGTDTENSDIDLLVDSGLTGLRFVGFLEEVRNVAGTEVDLLDVRHIEKGSPVDHEIANTGIVIYEQ